MNPACPTCGATGVPLMYGLPVPEARAAALVAHGYRDVGDPDD